MIKSQENDWILTKADLRSLKYGIGDEEKRKQLSFLVQTLGEKLTMYLIIYILRPQTVISTAVVFSYRFYYDETFDKYDYKSIGVTSIFIAGKVEEHAKKLDTILRVFEEIINSYDSSNNIGNLTKDIIYELELIFLNKLYFDLPIQNLHKLLPRTIRDLNFRLDEISEDQYNLLLDDVCLVAKNVMLYTELALRFDSKTICECIIKLCLTKLKVVSSIVQSYSIPSELLKCIHELLETRK